jgi:hypothetical protein
VWPIIGVPTCGERVKPLLKTLRYRVKDRVSRKRLSAGGAPLTMIKQYVEQQSAPD